VGVNHDRNSLREDQIEAVVEEGEDIIEEAGVDMMTIKVGKEGEDVVAMEEEAVITTIDLHQTTSHINLTSSRKKTQLLSKSEDFLTKLDLRKSLTFSRITTMSRSLLSWASVKMAERMDSLLFFSNQTMTPRKLWKKCKESMLDLDTSSSVLSLTAIT